MTKPKKQTKRRRGQSASKAMLDGNYAPTHVLRWERKHVLDCAGLPCISIQETSFAWVLMQLHESPYVGYDNTWKPVMPDAI